MKPHYLAEVKFTVTGRGYTYITDIPDLEFNDKVLVESPYGETVAIFWRYADATWCPELKWILGRGETPIIDGRHQ